MKASGRTIGRGWVFWLISPVILAISLMFGSTVWADSPTTNANGAGPAATPNSDRGVMEGFRRDEIVLGKAVKISDQRKHTILFIMGAALLILIIGTAVIGVSMIISGKQLFVAHMIMAGLTVTLAVAHAVASTVWFFPF